MKRTHFVAAVSAVMTRNLALAVVAVMLASCSAKEQLEACVSDTEPTLLLRQLNMDGSTKARFNECVAANGKLVCATHFLDRNNLLEACMKRNGFVSVTGLDRLKCLSEPVDSLNCFRRKWWPNFASD